MLWTFCPPTIWANSLEFSGDHLRFSTDNMYRACELKDQTYKKTRTLHFSEFLDAPEPTQNSETQKKETPRLRDLFRKVLAKSCLRPCCTSQKPTLSFLSLFFWNSLFFFPCKDFPCFFWGVFPFFSRDCFKGSVGIENPSFLVVFLAVFKKNKERKDRAREIVEQFRKTKKNLFRWTFVCFISGGNFRVDFPALIIERVKLPETSRNLLRLLRTSTEVPWPILTIMC